MSTLTNKKISDTYKGLLKTADETKLSATPKAITDGDGTNSGVLLDNAGNLKVNNVVEFGSLKDADEDITIEKFVDEADGIANNDNDTSLPTTAAVKDYVDTQITAEDLDFSGNSGTGDVDLDSEVFAITGSNGIITTALDNTLDIDGSTLQTAINTNASNISTNATNISQNETDIATNVADISTNASNIASNDTDIATNATNIATNVSNISANQSNITTNATNIASNTTDIASNASDIASNDTDISNLQTSVATNTTDIANNTADITQNATDITTNATAISTNASDISTNSTSIATNASDINTNTANIATNTSNISTNTSNIATNTGNITANSNDITANTDDIQDLQSDVNTNTSNIATNTTNISTNATNIANNDSDISALQTDVSTNTTNIATNTTNIAQAITGSGTADFLPKFTDTKIVGDSQISDDGTNVGINTTSGTALFNVKSSGSTPTVDIRNESLSSVGLTVRQSATSTADMQQWTNLGGQVKALVDAEGKIGINLTNPSKELDVLGEIRTARPSASPDGFAHVALNSQYTAASGIYFENDGGQFLLKDVDNNQNVKLSSNADSYVKGRFGVGDLLTDARSTSKFFVKNGDIQIDRPDSGTDGGGIILHTPDKQNRFKITIDNNGNLVTTQV